MDCENIPIKPKVGAHLLLRIPTCKRRGLQSAQGIINSAVERLDVPFAVASRRSLTVRAWQLLSWEIILRARPQLTIKLFVQPATLYVGPIYDVTSMPLSEHIVAFRSASHTICRSSI